MRIRPNLVHDLGQRALYKSGLVRHQSQSQCRRLSMVEIGPYYFTDNPYLLNRGDGGRMVESPVIYLLPYWLGRHHGVVGAED